MSTRALIAICSAAILGVAMSACSRGSASTQDKAIAQAVQSKLNADPALSGADITASTLKGVVTLKGTVTNDGAREAAATDAQVPGVTQVDNEIATNSPTASPSSAPSPANAMTGAPAQQSGSSSAPASAPASAAPASAPAIQVATPVEVEAGTPMEVRLDDPLSSANATAGSSWNGTLSRPIRVNGQIAIPRGAAVTGSIVAADSAGHYKGQSRLVLTLTQLAYDGQSYDLSSTRVSRLAASRSKRSAFAIGGGAALGALVGALAGHGKGAAIGGVSGAGAGTAAEGLTKPAEVNLPAETVLRFSLKNALQVVPAASAH